MNSLTLILALLTHDPEGLREKPEVPCEVCCTRGWNLYFVRIGIGRVPWMERCWNCDGYGKEVTIYGGLLRDAR